MVGAIALIVFGPQKLPEIARNIGRFMADMRRMAAEVKDEFASGLDEGAKPDPVEEEPVADEDTEAIDEAAPPPPSDPPKPSSED